MSSHAGSSRPWSRGRGPWIIATVVLFFAALGSCGGNANSAAPTIPPPTATSTVTVTVPAPPTATNPYNGGAGLGAGAGVGADADRDGTPDNEERYTPPRTGSSGSDDDGSSSGSSSSGGGRYACGPGDIDGDNDGRCNE